MREFLQVICAIWAIVGIRMMIYYTKRLRKGKRIQRELDEGTITPKEAIRQLYDDEVE